MRAMRTLTIAGLLLALAPAAALAADIRSAYYDPRTNEIVVEIAYRGTGKDHDFRVLWGECKESGVSARLVDAQGNDAAVNRYLVTKRVSLHELPCRPTVVTLRLGAVSHMSVRVPG